MPPHTGNRCVRSRLGSAVGEIGQFVFKVRDIVSFDNLCPATRVFLQDALGCRFECCPVLSFAVAGLVPRFVRDVHKDSIAAINEVSLTPDIER